MSRRAAAVLAGVVALGAASAGGAVLWVQGEVGPIAVREHCEATVDGRTVQVDLDQAANAATIAAVAQQRGLPARAVSIALATAYQESKLRNVEYGDRDSLGLFQQRPSQGWGTPEQVLDPVYAAGAFYDRLVQVPAYETLEITVAAQAVQRSAYADAYAAHEADARVLASALTGHSDAAFHCTLRPDSVTEEAFGAEGLTPRATAVRDGVLGAFGALELGGFAPGGITSGHMEGSAHYDGRAIDVFVPEVDGAGSPAGWAVASWLVANADRLGVATVIYDDRIWTARRSASGWRAYTPPGDATTDPTLRHLDHVHVDVIRGG